MEVFVYVLVTFRLIIGMSEGSGWVVGKIMKMYVYIAKFDHDCAHVCLVLFSSTCPHLFFVFV